MSLFLYQTSLCITRPLPTKKGRLNTGDTKAKIILVREVVIRLASATDLELWLGLPQKFLKTQSSGFLYILRILKKQQLPTVTKMRNYCSCTFILVPARANDPCC